MLEVEYCHEIDEFENAPLKDEVFSFNSKSININKVHEMNKIGQCDEFLPLTKEELEIFAKNGIDGDSLRRVNDGYVNTYFRIKYMFNQNGKLIKYFSY